MPNRPAPATRLTEPRVETSWEFHSCDGVRRFWSLVREVPKRSEGRTHKQYERFYLGLYLFALAERNLLSLPLRVVERDGRGPDFMMTWESGVITGLEVTRATDRELQEWLSHSESHQGQDRIYSFSPFGYGADQLEREWCNFVLDAIKKKATMLDRYKRAERHDLLVSDDTRCGAGDRRKVLTLLTPAIKALKAGQSLLGKVSVVASLDVLYDIGGESRIFPYVNWLNPEAAEQAGAESFAKRAEFAGRVTAERAIREPSQRPASSDSIPAPGYYVDNEGRIVKRTAEGRRFEVKIGSDGGELVVRELPRA